MDVADLYYTLRRLRSQVERYINPDEEPLPGYVKLVVRTAVEEPGISITQIVRFLGFSQSTVSQAVKQAAQLGFLRCEQDSLDRRRVRIYPSEAVHDYLSPVLSKPAECALSELLSDLPKTDSDTFWTVLQHLHDRLKVLEADHGE
jgi:DNA-binding MarR family transcriptional regulator